MSKPRHGAPQVVFVRFLPRDRTAALLAAFIFSLAGVPLMIAAFISSDWIPFFVGLVLMFCVTASLYLFAVRTKQRNRLKQFLRGSAAIRVQRRRIVEALVNLRRLESRFNIIRRFPWDYGRASRSLHHHAVGGSWCIIDGRLRRAMRRVHLIDDMLECEEVGESMQHAGTWTMVLAGLAALALGVLLARVGGGWVCGAAVCFVISFGLIASVVHRWIVAGRGSLARMKGIVVGMGFVADARHVWYAATCVTILRYENGKIHLTILDHAGHMSLLYLSAPMSSFVNFWQRWMHPHPRPELAAEFTTEEP